MAYTLHTSSTYIVYHPQTAISVNGDITVIIVDVRNCILLVYLILWWMITLP